MIASRPTDEIVKLHAKCERLVAQIDTMREAIYRRVEVSTDGLTINLGTQNGWPEQFDGKLGRWALIHALRENGAEISESHDGRGDHRFTAKFHGLTFRWAYDSSG